MRSGVNLFLYTEVDSREHVLIRHIHASTDQHKVHSQQCYPKFSSLQQEINRSKGLQYQLWDNFGRSAEHLCAWHTLLA